MAIRDISGWTPEQKKRYRHPLRMKADQAWEMAGLARQDGDQAEEKRWTEEARRLDSIINETTED